MTRNTIFSPATGTEISALSIIRISGPKSYNALLKLSNSKYFSPRKLTLKALYSLSKNKKIPIDTGLVVWMPSPNSYTGEDSVELYIHGGLAVRKAIIKELSLLEDLRHAEPGEFTKRAIVNGKINLTQAEGILDLINAETDSQREFANRLINGSLSIPIENWREKITKMMSKIESVIDFSDEEDIPENININKDAKTLSSEIKNALKRGKNFELINNGINIVLGGDANAGKSSLINCLARRDVAIVSSIPGTTRDLIEIRMDLGGFAVNIVDTAGITKTKDPIEKEGIKRAIKKISDSDIFLHVKDYSLEDNNIQLHKKEIIVYNKIDLVNKKDILKNNKNVFYISCKTGEGIDFLLSKLSKKVKKIGEKVEMTDIVFSRDRHEAALIEAQEALGEISKYKEYEIVAEYLRIANRALGKILGVVDVEEVLGDIFSHFCIGK